MPTDTEYVTNRNLLIPKAEKFANQFYMNVSGLVDPCVDKKVFISLEDCAARWNYLFHRKMDWLWKHRHESEVSG